MEIDKTDVEFIEANFSETEAAVIKALIRRYYIQGKADGLAVTVESIRTTI